MKKELILMRHGKSDWSQPVSDFNRPIKKRGLKEAARVGQWLDEQGLLPDLIISSPAQRARQTAVTVSEAMNYTGDNIFFHESVYMADVSELLDAIASAPLECRRLMMVGHNPGMKDLLFYLTEEVDVPDDGKVMPTATIAVLETEGSWSTLDHVSCRLQIIARGRYL
jgi:phosphohistidine phosphatase